MMSDRIRLVDTVYCFGLQSIFEQTVMIVLQVLC